MDNIFIKDLVVYTVIGVHDWERQKAREILINLHLFIDLRKSGKSDELGDTVDYGKVAEKVSAFAENAKCLTIEAFADNIARLCVEIPGVQKARVVVEKSGAIPFSRSVGIEIERSRTDY